MTLSALRRGRAGGVLVFRFELAALRLFGHLPALETLRRVWHGSRAAGRVPFGLLAGGVLCANCRRGKKQVVSVSAGSASGDWASWPNRTAMTLAKDRSSRVLQGELRGVMNRYLTHLLGHAPEMHRYLGANWTRQVAEG